jgi:hypothetical protein
MLSQVHLILLSSAGIIQIRLKGHRHYRVYISAGLPSPPALYIFEFIVAWPELPCQQLHSNNTDQLV